MSSIIFLQKVRNSKSGSGQVFSKENKNASSNSNQKMWRTNGLRTSALLGFIYDIHRVLLVSPDPVDVLNEPQQGTCPQVSCSSNFLMWICGVISILFKKTRPVLNRKLGKTRCISPTSKLCTICTRKDSCNITAENTKLPISAQSAHAGLTAEWRASPG